MREIHLKKSYHFVTIISVRGHSQREHLESNFHFSLIRVLVGEGSSKEMNFRLIQYLLISAFVAIAIGCKKNPPKSLNSGRKQSGDNGYRLVVGGLSGGYEPGKIYNCEWMEIYWN